MDYKTLSIGTRIEISQFQGTIIGYDVMKGYSGLFPVYVTRLDGGETEPIHHTDITGLVYDYPLEIEVIEARKAYYAEHGYEAHTVPAASVTRCAASPFKYGDTVEVAAVGVPAKVVGVSPDGQTLEVVYDDMVEIFKVPAAHTKRVGNTETTLETLVKLLAERDEQIRDMERQIADLIKERTTLRYIGQKPDYASSNLNTYGVSFG